MTAPRPDENRNALLALHFGEGDAREAAATRAHVEGCASCREYLALVSEVEGALLDWADEVPPPGLLDGVIRRLPPAPAPARLRPPRSALPLFALLPVMVVLVATVRALAGALVELSFWPQLQGLPAAEVALPLAVAAALLLAAGGLGTLALAPALVMENAGPPRGARLL